MLLLMTVANFPLMLLSADCTAFASESFSPNAINIVRIITCRIRYPLRYFLVAASKSNFKAMGYICATNECEDK